MQTSRRALYNSLRMNWVIDPTIEVETWQVEDYRSMPLDELFERLEDKDLFLDKVSFLAFADTVDTPEELTDALNAEAGMTIQEEDQIYLLIFELWRRLLPEKPSISIFCDELDYQIHLYDRGQVDSEAFQNVLANLQVVLDENTDYGADPIETLEYINDGCANDVESFLYDFIAEQIDNNNYLYASELLEGLITYVEDKKWFEFLRARLLAFKDPVEANQLIKKLIDQNAKNPDLEFSLEILSCLVRDGDLGTFQRLVKQSARLLKIEEDFQDLISICADFYHRLDCDQIENSLQKILKKRAQIAPYKAFDVQDPQMAEFFKVIA